MKQLNKYEKFDVDAFLNDIVIELLKIESYDDDGKKKCKIMVQIVEDNSISELGSEGPNQFENLVIKLDYSYNDESVRQLRKFFRKKISLAEPVAKRWGDYRENLSIKAKGITFKND